MKIKEEIEKNIETHPKVKGIIATNDTLSLIAFEVMEAYGLNMPIIGTDGTNEMIELIEERELPGTIAQNPFDMGYLSVETVKKVINGESVDKHIDSGVDIIIKGIAKQRLEFQKRMLK